ncbi:MAG: hypothetical protein V1709_11485 [Planctomycetota bacterium]
MIITKRKIFISVLVVLLIFIICYFACFFVFLHQLGKFRIDSGTFLSNKIEDAIIPLYLIGQRFSEKQDKDLFLLFPEMKDYLPEHNDAIRQAKTVDFAPKIIVYHDILFIGDAVYSLSAQGKLPQDNIYDIFKNNTPGISIHEYDYWGNQYIIERLDKVRILIFSKGRDGKRDIMVDNNELISSSHSKWIKYIRQNDDIGAIIFLDK